MGSSQLRRSFLSQRLPKPQAIRCQIEPRSSELPLLVDKEFGLVGVKVEYFGDRFVNGWENEISVSVAVLLRFNHDGGDSHRLCCRGVLPLIA